MKLLVDTDAFCKLGVAQLLNDALARFDVLPAECGRLPALPYMLRRGSLPRRFGADACSALLPVAESMTALPEAGTRWLDALSAASNVDPGEAQLLAVAADLNVLMLSGDKRALRAIKEVPGLAGALHRRIICLEAVLLTLGDRVGWDVLRQRVTPLSPVDTAIGVCFSAGNLDPRSALYSYFKSLATEVDPLVLWPPPERIER
jgi:hypothetical protein